MKDQTCFTSNGWSDLIDYKDFVVVRKDSSVAFGRAWTTSGSNVFFLEIHILSPKHNGLMDIHRPSYDKIFKLPAKVSWTLKFEDQRVVRKIVRALHTYTPRV